MNKHIALIASAMMMSGAAFAQSGAYDAEGSAGAETEEHNASGAAGTEGHANRDGMQNRSAGEARYNGQSASVDTQSIIENPQGSFAQLDSNRDGLIDPRESVASAPVDTNFDDADLDGNDLLSRSEFDRLAGQFEDEMAE